MELFFHLSFSFALQEKLKYLSHDNLREEPGLAKRVREQCYDFTTMGRPAQSRRAARNSLAVEAPVAAGMHMAQQLRPTYGDGAVEISGFVAPGE